MDDLYVNDYLNCKNVYNVINMRKGNCFSEMKIYALLSIRLYEEEGKIRPIDVICDNQNSEGMILKRGNK